MNRTVLIVDEDPGVGRVLGSAIEVDEVRVATDAAGALGLLAEHVSDVVVADVRMTTPEGTALVEPVRSLAPPPSVVLTARAADLADVRTLLWDGAVDFVIQPLEAPRIGNVLSRVFDDRDAATRRFRRDRLAGADDLPYRLVGGDARMQEVCRRVRSIAAGRASVLITGEPGTGKELVARAIHRLSPYGAEPFVAVDCSRDADPWLELEVFGWAAGVAADHRGRLMVAGSGTICLNEIGHASSVFQERLLRVLRDRAYRPLGSAVTERLRARLVVTSTEDLASLVARGHFSEALYEWLRVVEIALPALRERPSDLPVLVDQLLQRHGDEPGRRVPRVTEEAMRAIEAHAWPGNTRELEERLARAVSLAGDDALLPGHLGLGSWDCDADALDAMEAMERTRLEEALHAAGGDRGRAAALLGVPIPCLERLMRKHGVTA